MTTVQGNKRRRGSVLMIVSVVFFLSHAECAAQDRDGEACYAMTRVPGIGGRTELGLDINN